MTDNLDQIINIRKEKRDYIKSQNIDPYGGCKEIIEPSKKSLVLNSNILLSDFVEIGQEVICRGRIIQMRKMGKSCFSHIKDRQGKIQLFVQKDILGENDYKIFNKLDIGDIIQILGEVFFTKSGEKTVRVKNFLILSKSLRPLPDKYNGIKDIELRYRKRYLDLICSDESKNVLINRSKIISYIRNFLENINFIEVETPMLHPIAGGASAKPFTTYYNAMNEEVYLRIAPELYLKKLIVGGLEKVFEINRNFRNEGVSTKHNPEFTALEVYEAYSNCNGMIMLMKSIFNGCNKLINNCELDFQEISYSEIIKRELGIEYEESKFKEIHERYENEIEPNLIEPTFVTKFPYQAMPPLSKRCEEDSRFVDVFEFIVDGKELGCGYSEQNDPEIQRKEFEKQKKLNSANEIDEDFLISLEHGMPPSGGLGLGIDRLIMILTKSESIKDVIMFPHMKKNNIK